MSEELSYQSQFYTLSFLPRSHSREKCPLTFYIPLPSILTHHFISYILTQDITITFHFLIGAHSQPHRRHIAFLFPHHFSLPFLFKSAKILYTHPIGDSRNEWQVDQPISLFLFCSRETNTFLREGYTHRRPIADTSPFSTPSFLSSFFVQERKDTLYPPYWPLQK